MPRSSIGSRFLDLQDSEWHDVIDNNLNGTANTIRAFAPKMASRNFGRIIVVSSMQGRHGSKDAASYSASKWGVFRADEVGRAGTGQIQHHG